MSSVGLLNTTKIVMSAPLPRVFEMGDGGKAISVNPPPGTPGVIGGDFKGDDLTRASKDIVSLLSPKLGPAFKSSAQIQERSFAQSESEIFRKASLGLLMTGIKPKAILSLLTWILHGYCLSLQSLFYRERSWTQRCCSLCSAGPQPTRLFR